jgi:hypothetical protein
MMPKLKVLLQPMTGLPLKQTTGVLRQQTLGLHLRRQMIGRLRLRTVTGLQLPKVRRLTMIANQGNESLKMKITPCPTINTSPS